jgi:hypothetical protein
MVASRWRWSGYDSPDIGEKWVERGKLRPVSPFIGQGEREEVIMVPHIGKLFPPHHISSAPEWDAMRGHPAFAELGRRTRDTSSLSKGGPYKYLIFMCYQGHPCP